MLRPGGRLLLVVESLVLGLARLADQGRWAELADVPAADVVLVTTEDGSIVRCFWPELHALLTDSGLDVEWGAATVGDLAQHRRARRRPGRGRGAAHPWWRPRSPWPLSARASRPGYTWGRAPDGREVRRADRSGVGFRHDRRRPLQAPRGRAVRAGPARGRRLSVGAKADGQPLACVLGGMDIVSPLGRAGIACAVVVGPGDSARWSRYVVDVVDELDEWREPESYVARLVEWARTQPVRPVLYYPTDGHLLMASRFRDELARDFLMVLPDAELVEDLTDKSRFSALATRLGLPVPRSAVLPAGATTTEAVNGLHYPLVLKPVTHEHPQQLGVAGKAVSVANARELVAALSRLSPTGADLLAQELVPGPEARIESYHAYVDADGVVAEFTGQKSRTHPAAYGETTLLSITDAPDVRADGRRTVAALGLRGVCKLDYKRGDDDRLWLLEINARFNLWQNAGAAAGVNIPALVYADLTGRPRPAVGPARAGITWVDPVTLFRDVAASREPVRIWLRDVATATTRSTGDLNDPWPLLRGRLAPRLPGARQALERRTSGR